MNSFIKNGIGGEIISGKSKGWFLRIEKTEECSTSYLIIVSKDRNFSKYAEGYDYWAENSDDIQEFFREAKWVIKWLD